MLKAATQELSDVGFRRDVIMYDAKRMLEAALSWLDEILHERNVDFHRAILEAEKKRCPGNSEYGSVMARRVDFEYGVSFARNYIRDLFREPEPEVPEAVAKFMWNKTPGTWPSPVGTHVDIHNHQILEVYRLGQQSKDGK